MQRWVSAWVGVGSNLEGPAEQVRMALGQLDRLPETRCLIRSSLYQNPPMGGLDQPDYVNAVAGLLTRLKPRELLNELQALERAAGRDRSKEARWASRCLDLDLLTYGLATISDDELNVPHPGIPERNFVLLPLHEVAEHLCIPGIRSLSVAAQSCDREGLLAIADS